MEREILEDVEESMYATSSTVLELVVLLNLLLCLGAT